MSDLDRQFLQAYESAAAVLRENLAEIALARSETGPGVLGSYYFRRWQAAREAEERDRQEWIRDLKRRYGLVCTGEIPQYRLPWPGGVTGGPWEVISDHTLELHIEWPPECRCVLLDGEQVSLGGPCPVHAAA